MSKVGAANKSVDELDIAGSLADTDLLIVSQGDTEAQVTLSAVVGFINSGMGDMLISVYDPTAVSGDAFDMDNMNEGTNLILTASERTNIGTNTSKVTNATHTGDVTGSGALTIDKTAITGKSTVTAAAGDFVLVTDATDSDNLKKVNVSDLLDGSGDMLAATYDPTSVVGDAFDMDNMNEGTNLILTAGERTIIGNTSNTNTGDEVEASKAEIEAGTEQDKYISPAALNLSEPTLKTLKIQHTAAGTEDHCLEIDCDANGFGDNKAIEINYTTGAIGTGEDEAVILVNIDESDATDGAVVALEVLATEGDAKIIGMVAAAGVNPIGQLSGVFVDMDSALVLAVDRLTEFTTAGDDIQMFVADNDTITIGDAAKFEEIEFLLAIVASGAGIAPIFEFSTGIGTWAVFTPVDGTNGMRNTGVVAFVDSDIPTWAVGTGTEFLIRITRTRNVLSTPPTESKVQIAAVTEFSWDKDGDLVVNSVAATGTVTSSNLSGTNTGDQTSIVGITGTKAQFSTAVTDGTILYVGDVTSNVTTDISITHNATTVDVESSDGTNGTILQAIAAGNAGVMSGADKTNLDAQSGTNTGDEPAASLTVVGVVELATLAESDAGSSSTLAVPPSGLATMQSDIVKNKESGFSFVIDGGGATITTGLKGFIEVPFACTITAQRLFADQTGDIVIDLFVDSFANFPPVVGDSITASAKPTISSGVKDEDETLTGWTVALAAGDIIGYNVDSVTDIARLTVSLTVTKT